MECKFTARSAIGVFDSGLGGLTVVKELKRHLPFEKIVYFGDTARVPYGTKSKEAIIRFSIENTQILLKHNVKIVVVACNSSASYALKKLRASFSVPCVGVIGPGARKAVNTTRSGRIGVIATSATTASGAYPRVICGLNPQIKVFSQACPLFVPLVEEGWFDHNVTEEIIEHYLKPLKKEKIDTLILGCTHYPLLQKVIQKVVGNDVILIDSAKETAQTVGAVLAQYELLRKTKLQPKHQFFVSDKQQHFNEIAEKFLGCEIQSSIVKL